MTAQALTDDAPVNGDMKIYMYDVTAPAGHHLTLIADEDAAPSNTGIVGVSADGHYVYFIAVAVINPGLYLWHDGIVHYIANSTNANDLIASARLFAFGIQQARVTPDGHHLLYRALKNDNTLQLHVFDADTNAPPVCVSCDPTDAPSTSDATLNARTDTGAGSVQGSV
jgi:hypothetical protein